MHFTKKFTNRLKNKVSIVDIISKYVHLSRRGSSKELWGHCPFHTDHTPSFTVQPQWQSFNCFSCRRHGNVFNFLMDIDNISYTQAIKAVARFAGVQLPNRTHYHSKPVNPKVKAVWDVNKMATKLYHHILVDTVAGKPGLRYLHDRGFTDQTINVFHLGYAPRQGKLTVQQLMNTSQRATEAVHYAKLTNQYDQPRFYDRVMIPITDRWGHVVAFSGRTVQPDPHGMKYLNIPDTITFQKRQTFYNLRSARQREDKSHSLILMEGFMDVIAASQADVKNCIASLGTSLTADQVKKLRYQAQTVYIAYDGDYAGQVATKRAIGLFKRYAPRLHVGVIQMPDGLDPDEYRKQYSTAALKQYLTTQHKSTVAFTLNILTKHYNLKTVDGMNEYLNAAGKVIEAIKEPVQQSLFVNKLAKFSHVPSSKLSSKINAAHKAQTKTIRQSEMWLLSVILHFHSVLKMALHNKLVFKDGDFEADYSAICLFGKAVYRSFQNPHLRVLLKRAYEMPVQRNVSQKEIMNCMNEVSNKQHDLVTSK